MIWTISDRADPPARAIADRHYNRQKPGTPQFVPPGRCIVLLADEALWVTSWPFAEFVKHAWPGAWINSAFRKEGEGLASDYIREAVAATRALARTDPTWEGGKVPSLGMVTFIDPAKVRPRMVRGRPTWGHSYMEAGFKHVGYTKAGLWAMQLLPADMPAPCLPRGVTMELICVTGNSPDEWETRCDHGYGCTHEALRAVEFPGGESVACSKCGSTAYERDLLRLP